MPSWYKTLNGSDAYSGIFHYEQALELKKYCDVAIYYLFDRTLHKDIDLRDDKGIQTYRSKFENGHRLRNWTRIMKAFSHINKNYNPDIIYVHVASEAGRYAVILGKLFRKPVIITEHSAPEYSGMSTGVGKIMGRWIYSNCRYNVCVSEDLQNKMLNIFPGIEFRTIYNGVIKPEVHDMLTNQYRVEGNINIILVALLYSMDIKGIQYVIPAIRHLKDDGYEITLHIAGDGNYLQYFKKMANDYGIAEKCIFYGYCTKQKVYAIIKEMDFLVSASIVETFGCTLAEAMMLGKPVLATRSGGPDSFLCEKVGILIEAGSVPAIEKGIKEMILKYDKFDFQYIKKYAEEKFEMANVCKQYVELFENTKVKKRV